MNYHPVTINKAQTSPYHNGFESLAEQQLLHKGLKLGWNIKQDTKDLVLSDTLRIIRTEGVPEKLKLQAIRNLILMEGQNINIALSMMPKNIIHHNVRDLTDEELDQAITHILSQTGASNLEELKELINARK